MWGERLLRGIKTKLLWVTFEVFIRQVTTEDAAAQNTPDVRKSLGKKKGDNRQIFA